MSTCRAYNGPNNVPDSKVQDFDIEWDRRYNIDRPDTRVSTFGALEKTHASIFDDGSQFQPWSDITDSLGLDPRDETEERIDEKLYQTIHSASHLARQYGETRDTVPSKSFVF